MMLRLKTRQSGATLIELILSMVIISIALTGILSVMNQTVAQSANPVVQHQAISIAESYLEEILLQPYADPDGADGEVSRSLFDDVDDYNGLNDAGVQNRHGDLVAKLSAYNVSVAVSTEVLAGSVASKKVTVSVSGSSGKIELVGYRTNI
jgi:MSHA pilin protein MshD